MANRASKCIDIRAVRVRSATSDKRVKTQQTQKKRFNRAIEKKTIRNVRALRHVLQIDRRRVRAHEAMIVRVFGIDENCH